MFFGIRINRVEVEESRYCCATRDQSKIEKMFQHNVEHMKNVKTILNVSTSEGSRVSTFKQP